MESRNIRRYIVVAVILAGTALYANWKQGKNVEPEEVKTEEEKPYEVIAELQQGPGNIAVGPDGRMLVTLHQMYNPEIHIAEVLKDGTLRPYPNETWAKLPKEGSKEGTTAVLGIQIDRNGTAWFMDNGSTPPKLIAWDMKQEALKRVYEIPESAYTKGHTFMNDMAINLKDQKAYIADVVGAKGPAIIVLDLKTGEARRMLESDSTVQPEMNQPIIVEGKELMSLDEEGKPQPRRLGLNPITIDEAEEYVYYGAMHGLSLYRIPTKILNDPELKPEDTYFTIQRYGDKPVSDGISIDSAGNVYVTDLNHYGIGVTRPDGKYRLLYQDKDLFIWPDSIAAAPDNTMVVTVNQLNRTATLNAGEDVSKPPFYIVRFKPLAPVTVGR